MNKELPSLEALERLRPKTTYQPYYSRNERRHYCDIIKTELLDYKQFRKTLDKHGIYDLWSLEFVVKDYQDIKGCFDYYDLSLSDVRRVCVAYKQQEKQLKALEIIKKKRVAINILCMSSGAYVYNALYEVVIIPSGKTPKWEYKLTQEEFDLVKEVLLWVK